MTKQSQQKARVAAWLALPVAALLVAYLATRQPAQAQQAAAVDHSQHGISAADDARGAVLLPADQARRIGVTFAVAEMAPMAHEIRTLGQVTFDERRVSVVSLKVDGWVERLHVDFTGQRVSRGAPLLTIYSPMLVAAQEELLLARRLAADVAGGTAETRDQAASLVTAARRRLEHWDVHSSEIAKIERTGQAQRAITLRAPSTGVVVEKNVLEGQRVMAGEAIYRLADLGTVWVEGEVFERDVSVVRLGQAVTVHIDALAGEALTGRITYVHPVLTQQTRTSRVRVELSNRDGRLKPGMYATVLWHASGAVPALSVPRTAVIATGQRNLVFVKRADGMLEPRVVAIGAASPDRVQILSGLTAGDSVVRSATFLLDAESNLGTLLGGMGDMPGMDLTAPTTREKPDAHTNH